MNEQKMGKVNDMCSHKTKRDALIIRFNNDVTSVSEQAGVISIDVRDWKPIEFTVTDPVLVEKLLSLRDGRMLFELTAAREECQDLGGLSYYLSRFAYGQLLEWVLPGEGGDRVVIESLAKRYAPQQAPLPDEKLRLSRFAYLRTKNGRLCLECGVVPARVWFGADTAEWFERIAIGKSLKQSDPIAAALWHAGFVENADSIEPAARRTWEFHDALFHMISRGIDEQEPYGATYRFKNAFNSPTAVKPAMEGERVELIPPQAVMRRSQPLEKVMSNRSSCRDYAATPIQIKDLSELLYRVARTKEQMKSEPQDLLSRPYPAGGSINELEFYLAVNRCRGLAEGFYHYDGHEHGLVRLRGDAPPVQRMLTCSARAMGQQPDHAPDVLIVISARVPRMAWKYQSMAYRAILFHVGIVFQTLYLVATDMDLAACAHGSGDHWAFVEATGIDPWEETAVGEFALGLPAR